MTLLLLDCGGILKKKLKLKYVSYIITHYKAVIHLLVQFYQIVYFYILYTFYD